MHQRTAPAPAHLRLPLVLVAAASALLAACGAAQERPAVVGMSPAIGGVAPRLVREIRVDFDVPVRLLDAGSVELFGDGGQLPVGTYQLPGETHSIRVVPALPATLRPGGSYVLVLHEGLVVNGDDHYLEDEVVLSFEVGAAPEILLGTSAGDRVVVADPDTLAEIASTPTPGARDPVGVLGTDVADVRRVWVQLASGGGTGASLAHFSPGDAAMATAPLTHAGDLTTSAAAIAVGSDARTVYVAFRDEGLQRVRVARVDALTATETGSIVLSPAASALTAPTALAVDVSTGAIYVTCAGSAGARLCQIALGAFAEDDVGQDPGVDGQVLPSGAGPTTVVSTVGYVAPSAETNAHLSVAWIGQPVTEVPTTTPGVPSALALGHDLAWTLEGLSGYAAGVGLVAFVTSAPLTQVPIAISDDVGGVPTGATAVLAIGSAPATERFVALLDSGVAAFVLWDANGIRQEDADPGTPGVQSVALPPAAAGADAVGYFTAAVP